MILHTIIGEYDVMYAQENELAFIKHQKQELLSTNPADFLQCTQPMQIRDKEEKL